MAKAKGKSTPAAAPKRVSVPAAFEMLLKSCGDAHKACQLISQEWTRDDGWLWRSGDLYPVSADEIRRRGPRLHAELKDNGQYQCVMTRPPAQTLADGSVSLVCAPDLDARQWEMDEDKLKALLVKPMQSPPLRRRGPMTTHDWNGICGEIARRCIDSSGCLRVPENESELATDVLKWCTAEFDKEPAVSEMRAAVKRICAALRPAQK